MMKLLHMMPALILMAVGNVVPSLISHDPVNETLKPQTITKNDELLGNWSYHFKDGLYYSGALIVVSDYGRKVNFWETINTKGMAKLLPVVMVSADSNRGRVAAKWMRANTSPFASAIIDIQAGLQEGSEHIHSDNTFFNDMVNDHAGQATSVMYNRMFAHNTTPMRINFYYHWNCLLKDYVRMTFDD